MPVYSSFLQRAVDQIIHDVCIQNLPVVICIDRAGIVGNDGDTHQGIFDLSYLSYIPNLTILAPKDFKELEDMIEFAVNLNKPAAIRYPRGKEKGRKYNIDNKIEYGKAEILKVGEDISIFAIGKMVDTAMELSKKLANEAISAEVINIRFLKPLDEKCILESAGKTKKIITIEDNVLKGGLGAAITECIVRNNVKDIAVKSFGYPDEYIKHGDIEELEKEYGLDIDTLYNQIKKHDK